MTQEQLLKFIEVRNKSQFSSNLQFETDAGECGFDVKEMGDPKDESVGWVWKTSFGRLVERAATGKLSLT